MRILLLTNAFARVTNGPAKFAHYLLEVAELLPGHEVRVLTEDAAGTPEAEAAVAAGKAYPMPLRLKAWQKPAGQWLRMRQYYEDALEIRQTYAWDVLVYINAWQADYALRLGQVPVLGMINDDNNCRATRRAALRSRRGLKQWLFRRYEERVARRLPLVISNSRFLAAELTQAYRLPLGKAQVLYKSVDAATLPYRPERPWPVGDEPWRILFVKADFKRGGLQDLAQALASLRQFRFEVDVVGPGPEFQAEAEAWFAALPHVRLHYIGPQPQGRVRELLYAAHIFCVPARQEALGVANMEAALAGTPIVSTTAGGIPEVLDNGRAAFLAPPSDPAALAQALSQCLTDAAERARRQAHARAFVEATFSKLAMLRRFIDLVEKGMGAQ